MLKEGFDEIEERPFTSGGFAHVYRATYKGQLVAAKALKTTALDNLENLHNVSGPNLCRTTRPTYIPFSALCEGGCGMEMASTREHSTVRWSHFDATTIFDGLDLDGEWKYHDIHEGRPESESFQPRGYAVLRIWRY